MEGEKSETREPRVNDLLQEGIYVPDLIDRIYDEATPPSLRNHPFQRGAIPKSRKKQNHGGAETRETKDEIAVQRENEGGGEEA